MKYLLTILLSLSCCASTRESRLHSTQLEGFEKSYSKDITHNDIREVVIALLKRLGNGQKYYSTLVSEWRYEIIDLYIIIDDERTKQIYIGDGYTDKESKTIYVFLWQPCLAASSLPHELLHAMGYYHDDKLIFHILKTVLHREIIDELCGKDYEIGNPPEPNWEEIDKRVKADRSLWRTKTGK